MMYFYLRHTKFTELAKNVHHVDLRSQGNEAQRLGGPNFFGGKGDF